MTTTSDAVLRHVRELAAGEQTGALPDRRLLESFVARREAAAFDALVRRHGPMVLGVCRRVLHNWHDAEDAFQATFLVLAQNANRACACDALGGWLHGVAYRTAIKARSRAARQQPQRQTTPETAPDPLDEVTGRELLMVLDEELQRLPDRYRLPLVCCYLEGRTCEEAARQLGWALRTLKRRLGQGRVQLRARLERRGLGLSGALLAIGTATAAVPTALAVSAAESALLVVSGNAAALPQQVTRLMSATVPTRKVTAVLLLAVTLLGVGLLVRGMSPAEPPESASKEPVRHQAQEKTPAADSRTIAVAGRVLTPDGKAASGAHVAAVIYYPRRIATEEPKVVGKAEADSDGRYRLDLRGPSAGEPYFVHVRAIVQGYGLGAVIIPSRNKEPETTIQLVPERIAGGRLINLEGAPAAGVKLHVGLPNYGAIPEGPPWPGPLTTDDKGRFTLRGGGEGYRVSLDVEDDRFVRQRLAMEVPVGKAGAEPTFTLAPLRVLEGKVTQDDTGKPIANARVTVDAFSNTGGTGKVEVRTDEQGRYRLIPYDGNTLTVRVYAPDGASYLPWTNQFKWTGAAVRRALDVKLPRGVLIRGKVTEEESGKPVTGARVEYWPRRRDNPFYRRDVLELFTQINVATTDPDGTFQLALMHGPGHLFVKGPSPDYLHVETSYHAMESGKPGGQRYYPDALHALALKPGEAPADVAVTLRRGVTVKGRVLRPDGKPLAEGVAMCRSYMPWGYEFGHNVLVIQDGEFELPGCDPEKAEPVFFLDAKGQLGAVAELSGKQAGKEPVTVRLAACGSATVRFVDQDGKPWVNQRVGDWPLFVHLVLAVTPGATVWASPTAQELQSHGAMMVNFDMERYGALRTDDKGRVTFPTLLPGGTFRLWAGEGLGAVKKEFTVKPGEKVELGDVVMKRGEE